MTDSSILHPSLTLESLLRDPQTNIFWERIDSENPLFERVSSTIQPLDRIDDGFRYVFQGHLQNGPEDCGQVYLCFPNNINEGVRVYESPTGEISKINGNEAKLELIQMFETALGISQSQILNMGPSSRVTHPLQASIFVDPGIDREAQFLKRSIAYSKSLYSHGIRVYKAA